MKVITECKVYETDDDRQFYELAISQNIDPFLIDRCLTKNIEMRTEIIRGTRFFKNGKQFVILGLSRDIEEAIGVSLKELEDLKNVRDDLYYCQIKLQFYKNKVNAYKQSSWYKRFLYALKGEI